MVAVLRKDCVMGSLKWIRLGPGKLELTTWISDSRVTYVARWDLAGWTLTRWVAGAVSPLTMAEGEGDLAVLAALVAADEKHGL